MWKIRKFSLQSGFEVMITRMIDEVYTNWTIEAECDSVNNLYQWKGPLFCEQYNLYSRSTLLDSDVRS